MRLVLLPLLALVLAHPDRRARLGAQSRRPHRSPPRSKCRSGSSSCANGLNVILHRDASVPIVTVNVWYHVGSANERPGAPASRTSSST